MKINNNNLIFKNALKKRAHTDYIIVHHIQAQHATVEDIHRWHLQNKWSGIGYHFYIRKDGTVYQGRPAETIGSHCQGSNANSIGIACEGDYHHKDKTMPEKQMRALAELIGELRDKYPRVEIKKHMDLKATNCPGQYFPWREMIKKLKTDQSESSKTPDTNQIISKMEKKIPFDKKYWTKVFNGEMQANPEFLKIIFKRLLGM